VRKLYVDFKGSVTMTTESSTNTFALTTYQPDTKSNPNPNPNPNPTF